MIISKIKSRTKVFIGLIIIFLIIYPGLINLVTNAQKFEKDNNYELVEIHLTAKRYEFTPNRITVQKNVNLTLILHAEDRIHGFSLDGYNIEQTMCNDHVFTISFITNEAGTFLYRCSEPACGPYHPYMTGILNVEDNGSITYQVGIVVGSIIIVAYFSLKKEGTEFV
ncbi:MAG: Nitrous-oxide reductase [Candidatus Heimdallarchaeota archaeon LC_3]|nr:MAG: Nitrous-oxide reductase [Candidatus Heimdallarchaeota archaeon LC_3]